MSMTEHGVRAVAVAERCERCHEFHGPGWGAKECAQHTKIFERMAKRQERYRVRVATGPDGKPI